MIVGNDMARARKPDTSKTGAKSGELSEAIVLVPLTYNDGSKVPMSLLESIHDELLDAFDGWTINGVVKGAYRMQSGRRRVENLEQISVVLEEGRLIELENMIANWAAILGQETMLLKITGHVVKFISPKPEAMRRAVASTWRRAA